jgi:dihydrofolate reductase
MILSLIAAIGDRREIGYAGKMPWHMPADLRHFKEKTIGQTILMGRKTFDSLGGLLPDRRHVIVSHQFGLSIPGATVCPSIEAALAHCAPVSEVMVIGGTTLYAACLPLATRLVLTEIHAEFAADAFFPAWEPVEWREVSRREHRADLKNPYDYSFVELERIL